MHALIGKDLQSKEYNSGSEMHRSSGEVDGMRISSPSISISFDKLFPAAVILPWRNEEVLVASHFLWNAPFCLEEKLPDAPVNPSPRRNSIDLLLMAHNLSTASIPTLCVKRSTRRITEGIEYVACHWARREDHSRPLLLLCSMKLQPSGSRETMDSGLKTIAENIHSIANEAGLEEGQYYVVVYCCRNEASIDSRSLPKGTIIVGVEGVRAILQPFGLSFLLFDLEGKVESSRIDA